MSTHILPIRVYYEDTDTAGIVYHGNYLNYFERARTESLRELGFELVTLLSDHNTQFVVHSAFLEFLQPARLDQLLYVLTEIEEVRHASILYNQSVYLEAPEGTPICKAKIKIACLDSKLQVRALPEILLKQIKNRGDKKGKRQGESKMSVPQ